MSFDYFLSSKQLYENIFNDLNNAINNYEDLLTKCVSEYGCFNEEVDLYFSNNMQNIKTLVDIKTHIKENICSCNKKIQSLCEHKFVDDSVDITPDTSKKIRYCEICEYTVK